MRDAILLVPPEPMLGRAMTRLLAAMGHEVATVKQTQDPTVLKDIVCVIVDEQNQHEVPEAACTLPHIILTPEFQPAHGHIKAVLRKPFTAEELEAAILQACLPPRLQHTDSAEWGIFRDLDLPAA